MVRVKSLSNAEDNVPVFIRLYAAGIIPTTPDTPYNAVFVTSFPMPLTALFQVVRLLP